MLLLNVLANACYKKKNKIPTLLLICHLSSDCMHLKERSVACKLLHVKYNNNRHFFCLVLLLAHKLLIGGSSAKQSSKPQLSNQKSAILHGNNVHTI